MQEFIKQLKRDHDTAWKGGGLKHRKEMFQLAKKVCSQEGLSLTLTNDLLMTIGGESGFSQFCLNDRNTNGSVDFGICQFNTGSTNGKAWWIGPSASFKDPQEVINNPEKCIRVMARAFKSGSQARWYAYAGRKQHANQLIELSKPPEPILEEKKATIEAAKLVVPEIMATNTPTIINVKVGLFTAFIIAMLNWFKRLYNKKG